MEIDSEKDDWDKTFELEDASTTTEEVPIPFATSSIDKELCQKLLDLPAPKASLERTCIKSMHMGQILLLRKMDARRLMKKTEHKCGCCAHECKYYLMLIKLPWKVKGDYENKVGRWGDSCHTWYADRHLESHCDEMDRNSIIEMQLEKYETN